MNEPLSKELQHRIKVMQDWFERNCPDQLWSSDDDDENRWAPRPAQFAFCKGFYSWEHRVKLCKSGESDRTGFIAHSIESGTGKTTSMWAALQRGISVGRFDSALVLDMPEFTLLCRHSHRGGEFGKRFANMFRQAREVAFLGLDDLGTEGSLSDATEETLFIILNHRCAHGMATVVTSNSTPVQISQMFSRRNHRKILRRLNQFFLAVDFEKVIPLPPTPPQDRPKAPGEGDHSQTDARRVPGDPSTTGEGGGLKNNFFGK